MTFEIANSSFRITKSLVANYHLTDDKFVCLLENLQGAGIWISTSIIDNNPTIKKQFDAIEDYVEKCYMVTLPE